MGVGAGVGPKHYFQVRQTRFSTDFLTEVYFRITLVTRGWENVIVSLQLQKNILPQHFWIPLKFWLQIKHV